MAMNTESVDAYLRDGCGRCALHRTPQCKVHRWTEELTALRRMLRATELTEEMKWGSPCYTLDGDNVILLAAFKECCVISFPKGVALPDPGNLLEAPGPNTRVGRVIKLRGIQEVERHRAAIAKLVDAAVALHRSGVKVDVPPASEPMPEELERRLEEDAALRQAYEALTPGRQRSHVLYVGGAKQAATRVRRVERCVDKILAGRGFNER